MKTQRKVTLMPVQGRLKKRRPAVATAPAPRPAGDAQAVVDRVRETLARLGHPPLEGLWRETARWSLGVSGGFKLAPVDVVDKYLRLVRDRAMVVLDGEG